MMSRPAARLILVGLLVVLAIGVLPVSHPPETAKPPADRGDSVLHQETVERIRAGDPYYVAVGTQLRQDAYPATRIFNWRTPAHFTLLATLSLPVSLLLLRGLAVAALLVVPIAFSRQPTSALLVVMLAQIGAVATAARAEAVVFGEIWAGVLILISLVAYYSHRWTVGACLGVAAVFMRELAAPYCLACGVLALAARRRREAAVWVVGGLAYAAYFGFHAYQVSLHQQPGDITQAESWIRWNGLAFSFATMRANGWLGLLPHWATVLFTVMALAGATTGGAPQQVRLSLAAYLSLFAIAGQPFNSYWGFVTAPIWAFALGHGVGGMRKLVQRAKPKLGWTEPFSRLGFS